MTFTAVFPKYGGNDHTVAKKCFDLRSVRTEMWIAKGPYSGEGKDTIAADAYIQITFPEAKQIGSIRMTQGKTSSADVFKKQEIQSSTDGGAVGKGQESCMNAKDQTVNINVTDKIKGIRLVNKEQTAGWVRIGELDIRAPKNMTTPITYKVIKTERWKVAQGKETSLYDLR